MPQQTQRDTFYDSLYTKYREQMEDAVGAPPKIKYPNIKTQEAGWFSGWFSGADARRKDVQRTLEQQKGIQRGGLGEFKSQLLAGTIESAAVAPSLWEQLGFPVLQNIPKWIEAAEGEYAGDWEELSGVGKAGYGIGTGIGMLAPFGLAGKIVGKGIGLTGRVANLVGKTPWAKRATIREVTNRASQLTGKSAVKLSDDAAREAVDVATKAVGDHGLAAEIGAKIGSENFEQWAKIDIASRIGANVPKGTVDDLVNIAYEAVTSMKPDDAHAFLSATIGRIPGIRDRVTGELLAAYSYDAMIGATMGFMRFNAENWSDHMEKTGTRGPGTFGAYRKEVDFHEMISEMGHEAFWIGFLGPVRMIRGGTAGSIVGKGATVARRMMGMMKKVDRMTPNEARSTLKMIDDVSTGALRHSKIPSIEKAMRFSNSSALHWSDNLGSKEVFKALKEVRREFLKRAPGLFAKEAAKDFMGSLPRMLIGATTMNLPSIKDLYDQTGGDVGLTARNLPYTWGETLPEIAANVAIGMVFTKKGRGLRMFDKGPREGLLEHGKTDRWVRGQDNILKRMVAGMERVGYSTKHIRGLNEHQMWDYDQSVRYQKGMENFDFQNSSTYKNLMKIVEMYGLDTSGESRGTDVEGRLPLLAAFMKKMNAEKDVKERAGMKDNYKIANKIISHLEGHSSKAVNFRMVTPDEAYDLVHRLSSAKINGRQPNIESISRDLTVLEERTFGNTVRQVVGKQQSYLIRLLDSLGYGNAFSVDSKGNMIFTESFSTFLRRPKGASDETADMYSNIDKLMQDGQNNGWLKYARKRVPAMQTPSMEQITEAGKIHDEITDDMHKMVYGQDWTRESKPNTYDSMIISDATFGTRARDNLNLRQSRNVISLLSGRPEAVDSSQDTSDVTRVLEDMNKTLRASTLQIVNWNKVTKMDAKEQQEHALWLNNVKRIHNLLNPKTVDRTANVEAAEIVELKKKMDMLTGDAFVNEGAFQTARREALKHAVENIGMENQSYPSKMGILSLLNDRNISEDSESLPQYYNIKNFLDMMERSGEISEAKRAELDSWYQNEIEGAIVDSGTNVIKLKDISIAESSQKAWLEALQDGRTETLEADQMNVSKTLQTIYDKIERTQEKVLERFDTFDEAIDADKELVNHLSNGMDRLSVLKNTLARAIYNKDIDLYKEISSRDVAITEALDNLSNAEPSTGYEAYVLALTKQLHDLHKFETSRLTESELTEMIDSKIEQSTVKVDRETGHEPIIRITPAQFSMKYGVSNQTLESVFKWLKDNKKMGDYLNAIRDENPALFRKNPNQLTKEDKQFLEMYNVLESNRKKIMDSPIEYTPKQIANIMLPSLRRVALFNTLRGKEIGIVSGDKLAEIQKDIDTDSYQIVQQLISSKNISVLEFRDGAWDMSRRVVSDFNSGFIKLENSIPGINGHIYLMAQSGRVNGRHHNFLTPDVIKEINRHLAGNEMVINSLELEQQFMRSGLDDFSDIGTMAALDREILGSKGREGEPYHIIHLDENTSMVVRINDITQNALAAAFTKGSDFYTRMDKGFALESNDRMRQVLQDIAGDVGNIETFERGMLFIRLYNDFPTRLEQHIDRDGQVDLKSIKKLWRRFVLTEPKGGIYGSEKNIDFALESYRIFSKEGSELHTLTLEAMERSFASPIKTWVVNDDKSSSNGDNLNPLDAYEIVKARADYLVSKEGGYQITPVERDNIINDASSLKGRGVADADWYLTKERFLAMLGLFGVRDNMLQIENGEVVGFHSGGIKPTVALSEVNADGSMRVFIGKTAFKYDPAIDRLLKDKEVHALTFSSANKIWDTKNAIDNGRVQPTEQDNWQKPPSKGGEQMKSESGDGWVQNVIESLNADAVIDLPWDAINFKQVSREHIGSPGPNMFVHFSKRGMESGKRWLDIEGRLGRFEENFHHMILDPYARTKIARAMIGFSVEAGDNSLARTGMDYIIEQHGLLIDSWQHAHIERAMISYYLNGGNTSHAPMPSSSMDIMTAEPGTYDIPVRIKNGGFLSNESPVQTKFGGKGISAFLGDKTFVRSGFGTYFDGETIDKSQGNSSAFVFRHQWESKSSARKGQVISEEGLVFENELGKTIVTFRGLQIQKEGNTYLIRRLAEMDNNSWSPIDESLFSNEAEWNRRFFENMYDEVTGDVGTYAELKNKLNDPESGFRWTNRDVVNELDKMGTNQDLWLASKSVRQPRNAPGDILINKVHEVLPREQGNVEKTNTLDALKHADADFDFDKNTTYMAAPHGVWSDVARLSGSKIYADEQAVIRAIEERVNNSMALLDNGMMRTAQGDMISGALVRGRFVKMHQVMTYIQNMFRGEDSIITGQIGDNTTVRVTVNKDAASITSTSDFISRWVNAYIDLYNKTPNAQMDANFVNNQMWNIWFGTESERGLFNLEIKGKYGEFKPEDIRLAQFDEIKQFIKARILSPVGRHLTYNRGLEQRSDGYKQQASLSQMATAYRTLLYSLRPDVAFNGYESSKRYENQALFKTLSVEPALTLMRSYFSESSNPFDYGMKRLMEIDAKKYIDIEHGTDGIAGLIMDVENGNIDTRIDNARYNGQLQTALHHYVKTEAKMVEVVNLERQIQAKIERIEYLDRVYGGSIGESAEGKIERKKLSILEHARDTLISGIGLHRDFVLGKYGEAINEIRVPKDTEKRAAGKWENRRGKPVGVMYKGELLEVILKGDSNKFSIPNGAIVIESPRRYVLSGQDNTGTIVNYTQFVGAPVYSDGDAITQKMSRVEWEATKDIPFQLRRRLADIAKRYSIDTLSPKELGARETEKLRAIHDLVNAPEWKGYTENMGTLGKWAILQRMLVPELSSTDMEISPLVGISQSISIVPKLTMTFGGSIEKNVITYLNDIRTGNGFTKGTITKDEATKLLKNYSKIKNIGYEAMRNKWGDLDVIAEGIFADDVDISRHHLFQTRPINQQIFQYRHNADKNIQDAANTLIKYAAGDVMVDPFVLYKSARELRRVGIQENQIFGKWVRQDITGEFGQSTRMDFVHPLDAKGERGRRFGDQSSIDEGIDGMIDRIFCRGK
jgi:hypothetical protein|tara:strand:+ start:699 stop:9848 length:9150 start_codon:yes stop_codon:yes gene_type:complete